ncbi:hypothetical protein [Pseudarthrobacter sp. H2]|uniref:hypothetical protein n=1 Tax=Pseudarthrobacter sp. H2 TaxID=3418415 RepID=UPI003CEBBCE0
MADITVDVSLKQINVEVTMAGAVNSVTSVAGKQGAVTLAKADVGLSNVDNTSDLSKPISTATQTAISTKADKTYVDTQDALNVLKSGDTMTGALVTTGLTVDTNTLHVDPINNRVGIGTASPLEPLHVVTSDYATMRFDGASDGGYFYADGVYHFVTMGSRTATDVLFVRGSTPQLKLLSTGIEAAVVFKPVQAPTASAPAYVKGGIYFDTTLNKLRIGGATGWETITSS